MQEFGVWVSDAGATPARMQLESAEDLPGWASGALKGAATGAATGAVAGPYGAIIGAVAGAGLGAAAGASAPSGGSSPAPSAAPAKGAATGVGAQPSGDSRARTIQALQQFAAVVPVLVQLVAASGGKESTAGDDGSRESFLEGDWGPESFQGSWSVP